MTNQSSTCIALGNFDGVHRGHRKVIEPVLQATPRDRGNERALVVSLNPHPQEFFSGQRRSLLTPIPEKRAYLRSIGADDLALLPFDAAMAMLTPAEFVETILVNQLNATFISVGQNFRFGHQRAGSADDLRAIASTHNIPVHIAPLYCCGSDRVSSSAIRQALTNGDVDTANRLLGRSYALTGSVTEGQRLGRTIGFPTANLRVPANKFLPQQGVYAVMVSLSAENAEKAGRAEESRGSEGEGSRPNIQSPNPESLSGVMNIGTRPTVNGTQQTVEVHILNWSGDLYNKTVTVHLQAFLRPEQKFDSLDQLKAQIAADCEQVKLQL